MEATRGRNERATRGRAAGSPPAAAPMRRRWIGKLLVLLLAVSRSASGFLPAATTFRTAGPSKPPTGNRGDEHSYEYKYNNNYNYNYNHDKKHNRNRNPCGSLSSLAPRHEQDRAEAREPSSPRHPAPENSGGGPRATSGRITRIECENLAGMSGGSGSGTTAVVVDLSGPADPGGRDRGNLVCVTGETGSGKSLLVSRVADLLTGGKAGASLLQGSGGRGSGSGSDDPLEGRAPLPASVEMELVLRDSAHKKHVAGALRGAGIDPAMVLAGSDREENGDDDGNDKDDGNDGGGGLKLRLKRVVALSAGKKNTTTAATAARARVKSACSINGHPVTLRVLRAVAAPLVAVVDAPVAASALGREASRLAMVDAGLPPSVPAWVRGLQAAYRARKRHRESLERDLSQRVLPVSLEDEGGDGHLELLGHWIEELDGFARRITEVGGSLAMDSARRRAAEPELARLLADLEALEWGSAEEAETGDGPVLYDTLLDLHAYLGALDARIGAAEHARDALASLSDGDSARAALERTRGFLVEAAGGNPQRGFGHNPHPPPAPGAAESRVGASSERAHELLNLVEDALLECSRDLDDDEKGLPAVLGAARRACPIGTEELSGYLAEWNVLARKHGVPPHRLPLCHEALRTERDGGIEAGRLLPEARAAERAALADLEEGCRVLTEARTAVCRKLSASVSRRLPRLGMEDARFEARLSPIDEPAYTSSRPGADEVGFYLLRDDEANGGSGSDAQQIGGRIETVASSGEKARILLAIECEISGSIGAAIGGFSAGATGFSSGGVDGNVDDKPVPTVPPPLAVIYDEIDAHVGGRASISVARMLYDQSEACQVVSITHGPSLAAMADTHLCVQRVPSRRAGESGGLCDVVAATPVRGEERIRELARMASGDTVGDEAEAFAEALLRDASSIREGSVDRLEGGIAKP